MLLLIADQDVHRSDRDWEVRDGGDERKTGRARWLWSRVPRRALANTCGRAGGERRGGRARRAQRRAAGSDTGLDRGSGGSAVAVPTDLSSESDCKALIERVHEALGPIDILVLNAGSGTFGKLEELPGLDAIRDSMDVNFFGAAYPTYYALRDLIAGKGWSPT